MTNQEEYTRDFIDCVNELVEEFARNINISRDIDGKWPISFEDFFRYLTINYPGRYDDELVYIIALKDLCFHDIIPQLLY